MIPRKHGAPAVDPAFSTDVENLAQAFDQTAHLLEHANTIPVDFENDTRIIAIKDDFTSFLAVSL